MESAAARLVLVPGTPLTAVAPGGSVAGLGPTLDAMERALSALGGAPVLVVGTDAAGGRSGACRTVDGGSVRTRRWGPELVVGSGTPIDPRTVPDAAVVAYAALDAAGSTGPRRFVPVTPLGVATASSSTVAEDARRHLAAGGLVVVVADGPAALHPKAPIPLLGEAVDLDDALARWLATGGELPAVDPGEAQRLGWYSAPAWTLLAALRRGLPAGHPAVVHSAAPVGVGYHVAAWPAGPTAPAASSATPEADR